ncbi:MAG: FHA domain-containing protein [Lachnospiraceae bacterium]|nr:FHA domain-containing protein [Lachnospiraceae bacterium]
MYTLKDEGIISEIKSGNNFEYVLSDDANFANTAYKVLQSQKDAIFVKCMKITRNGLFDLYYVTDGYVTMSSMFAGINVDTLATIVINLLGCVLEVRHNGFLECQCIDLSWDKIFVDKNTLKVKLIYLPLNIMIFESYVEFENEFRSSVVKIIDQVVIVSNSKMDQLVKDLRDGNLSLEEVYNRARNVKNDLITKNGEKKRTSPTNREEGTIKLVAMNAPDYFEIIIEKDYVVLGKKRELVDLVIPFNKMISRKHCSISKIAGIYYIKDEGSANGTYVNGEKLSQGQKIKINRGDVIRLANSDFQIV